METTLLKKAILKIPHFLYLKIYMILVGMTFLSEVQGQTTEGFTTSPTLIEYPGVPSWKTTAEVTIDGVVYQLSGIINGTWAFSSNGGVGNSSSLHGSSAGSLGVTIKRKDSQRFQFYGAWLKYTNMTTGLYTPPYLTVNYNGSGAPSVTHSPNTTVTLSTSQNVTSVTLMFTGLMDLYLDNLIVGPAIASLSTVTTASATNVAGTMATLGGNVTNDGGGIITERGVVYSTTPNPTTANTKIIIGSGLGAFSEQVSGLSLNTTYFARAYSINSEGASYGSEITFSTTDGSGPVAINPNMDSASDGNGDFYPTATDLYIGHDDEYGYGFQEGFMKFIIPADLTGSLLEAKLRVNVYYIEGSDIFLKAFGSNNDSWVENSEAVPSKDHSLGQTSINSTGWIEIDVTSFVQTELNGDKVVSLVLNGSNTGMSYAAIYSRESANKPELVLTMQAGVSLPTITTSTAASIGSTSATLGGNVTHDGGDVVIEKGIVWNTSSNPTTSDNKIQIGTGTGAFSQSVTGLPSSTTLYVRAYAINSEGTSYGGLESFMTSSSVCSPTVGLTDFEGLYSSITELISNTGSATATVECFDFTSETLNPSHIARVMGTSISGNEMLIIQGNGTSPNANLARTIIKSNDGSEFSFKSIKVQPFGTFTDWDIQYQGYRNGVLVSGASLSRDNMVSGTMYTDSFSAIGAFGNVDEIRIEFTVVGTSFQNFRIDDVEIGAAVTSTVPALSTNAATSISSLSATLNGTVTSDGGASVTERGFVYSTSENSPTIGELGVIQVADGSGTGTFSESVTGLSPSTTYYYQAYATNSEGTSYGGVENFTTASAGVTLSTNPTLTFIAANEANLGATITDGQFGSTTISDANIQLFEANSLGIATGRDLAYYSEPLNGGVVVFSGDGSPMLVVAEQAGKEFDFRGIEITEYSGGGYTLKIEGIRNEQSTGFITTPVGDDFIELIGTSILTRSIFQNVDRVEITDNAGSDIFIYLNKISVGEAVVSMYPTVTDANISISGATGTGGAFKIGDTITATWNNTASGDNNSDLITSVTVDFSQFGGGAAIVATNNSGTWTATYTITAGAIDASNRTISVTATNIASNPTTTADSSNATVDNIAPIVSNAFINISGGTGTAGAFKIGDTVTATWDNSAIGDDNRDTVTGVTVDFSQFGGGAAVAATNNSGTWTATYTITAGVIDAANRNVSITASDNAGNTTTTADTTNATVDNVAPTVTDANISISGATGTGGAFKIGDTITATWNNTAGGDNNSDVISSVSVDFSQFGGGATVAATNSSGTWTANYTITAGTIDAANRNITITATDNSGNTTSTADTTNSTLDNIPAAVASVSVPANGVYIAGNNLDFTVNTDQNITVDTGGGTPRIALTIGSVTRYATYISGSGSSALTFRYTVQSGDLDINGITIGGNIEPNGGSLQDISGNDLITTLNAVGSTADVLVDAVAPNAPVNLNMTAGSDSGSSSTDDLTNDTTPTITGQAEANATITLYDTDGTTVLATTTANGVGNWLMTSSALSEGVHFLTAKATDAAGNQSVASTALAVTIDTTPPSLTDGNISISGATGTGGAFKIGDTVTATWDNTVGGDNNSDVISAVTVNFSQFGGEAAVVATNSLGTWTASYIITSGSIDAINRNVSITATDNAGNTTTTADTTNAKVDNIAPTVSLFAPANEAIEIPLQPMLTITFDDEVELGNEGIVKLSMVGEDGCTVESFMEFDLNNPLDKTAFELSLDKLSVSLEIKENLPANTKVIMEIPAGFVYDLEGNAYIGFSAVSYTWSFNTINKNNQSITFEAIQEKTYGDAPFTLGDAFTDQGLTVTYTAEDPTVVSIIGNQATILKTGSSKIIASQAGDGWNFAADPIERELVVIKASLTIKAENKSKILGSLDPTLSFTATGFAIGEGEEILSGSLSREAGETAGAFAINQGTLSAGGNYTINFIAGSLTILGPPSFTSTPIVYEIGYGENYEYAVRTTASGDELSEITAPVLPSWLNFSTEGQSQATVLTTFQAEDAVLGLTGDASGNNFAITGDGTRIFKILPDGSYTLWASGLAPKLSYSMALDNDYLYIGVFNGEHSITRISIDNPGAGEEVVLTRTELGGGVIKLLSNGDFLFASVMEQESTPAGLFKINKLTKEVENYLPGESALGFMFDENGDFYFSRYNIGGESSLGDIGIVKYSGGTKEVVLLSTHYYDIPVSIEKDKNGFWYVSYIMGGGIRKYEPDFSSFEQVAADPSHYPLFTMLLSPSGNLLYGNLFDGQSATELYSLSTGAVISGVPSKSDLGQHPVTLRASNEAGSVDQEFIINVVDRTAPVVSSFSPENSGIEVELKPTLTITFDEEVVLGDLGVFKLGNVGLDACTIDYFREYDLSNPTEKSAFVVSEDKLSVSLAITENLPVNTKILVEIPDGFVADSEGNEFIGFNAATYTWTFTTINKNSQAITFGEIESKSYGDATFILGNEVTDQGLTVTFTAEDLSVVSIVGNQATILKAGSTTITATQDGDDVNFAAEQVERTLTVEKAELTVAVEAGQSKVYGSADPIFSYTATGFENGDDETILSGILNRTAGENVGSYAINLGSLEANDNYSIDFTGADFAITAKTLNVAADAGQKKVYGSADPIFSYTATGLEFEDDASILSGTLNRSGGENVGSYAISLGSLEANDNYSIDFTGTDFMITSKTLNVTADAGQKKVYGSEDPIFSYTATGFEFEDDASILSGTLNRSGEENVGSYAISLGSLEANDNYSIDFTGTDFEITAKTLTIEANAEQSKVYGAKDPVFSYTATGFENGDDETILSGILNRTAGENVGSYTINLGSLEANNNYSIDFTGADFAITAKTLSISANAEQSKVYGSKDPVFTYTASGFEFEDDASILSGTLNRSEGENVGSYAISLGSLEANANYNIDFKGTDFMITSKTLTIKVKAGYNKVYGSADPVFNYSANGFEFEDNAENILTGTLSRTAGENVGSYAINQGSLLANENYIIDFTGTDFAITAKSLTITADTGQSKYFMEAEPVLTYQVVGLANGDGLEVFSGKLGRVQGEVVGIYPVNLGDLSAGNNYLIDFKSSNFEIIGIVISELINPLPISVAWGTPINEIPFPATIVVLTDRFEYINIPVNWNSDLINTLQKGNYLASGKLQDTPGYYNPNGLEAAVEVTVLPKPAPQDVSLDVAEFEGKLENAEILIGEFVITDPLDNIHEISFIGDGYDNKYFEIRGNSLYWISDDKAAGKTVFTIIVRVTDRDGNTFDKFLEITRLRESVKDIKVYNVFSPNGDNINDTWGVPEMRFYQGVRIQVFDRGGVRMFITTDPDVRWDGMQNGNPVPVGTYFWTVEVQETNEIRKGMLNILKQ
jgi:gliding motility-associated-like protein